jgi:hypothetical protein
MICPGLNEMPLAVQAAELAQATPTIYSSDTRQPFEDIGLGMLDDDDLGTLFEGRQVLDIGSGAEGVARRLFGIFGDSAQAPTVINLNPQEGTMYYGADRVLSGIKAAMEISDEDYAAYMRQRKVCAGVVQDMPFEDGQFDIQISTWAFPNCMFDCDEDYYVNDIDKDSHALAGYREILRTQAQGGVAWLAPIAKRHQSKVVDAHLKTISAEIPFVSQFIPVDALSTVLQLRKSE